MQVSISTDPYTVFQDAEWALMIGAKPRGPGQERADLLDQNGRIFVEQVSTLGAVVMGRAWGGGRPRGSQAEWRNLNSVLGTLQLPSLHLQSVG